VVLLVTLREKGMRNKPGNRVLKKPERRAGTPKNHQVFQRRLLTVGYATRFNSTAGS